MPIQMLGQIALWWCYLTGVTIAVGVYCVIALWAIDRLTTTFKVKREFIEWYWEKLRSKREDLAG